MIRVYVCHPQGTFKVKPTRTFYDVSAAIDCAIDHMCNCVSLVSVWIETDESRIVMQENEFTADFIARKEV